MAAWSHYLLERRFTGLDQSSEQACFQAFPPASPLPISEEKFDSSVNQVILQTFSSSLLQKMSRNGSDSSILCGPQGDSIEDPGFRATATAIPRRNLAEAFDELYIEPSSETETPQVKQASKKDNCQAMVSPTGVAEFGCKRSSQSPEQSDVQTDSTATVNTNISDPSLPHFVLHHDLKRELSDGLVDRVSFYAVIHDVNREATTMASQDDSGYNRNPEDSREEYDPLIVAVNGCPKEPLTPTSSMINAAVIDEERWLLKTIDSRGADESRSVKACPPTFLQAMGERDYENPLASLSSGSRTQLWKPSRSWWEAKSGKNPWIEPKSHNKRWRYLWPLIHYHKFLARCIKKLKRNGVDVKTSVSPVSVFLREEVCAVSDHLADVSLFDSNKWMQCLEHFSGWTDSNPEAEIRIRGLVSKLNLRPISEPGDVDSPLLRSQIDEQYLRAMATARAQMICNGSDSRSSKDVSGSQQPAEVKSNKFNSLQSTSAGPPPPYPRQNGTSPLARAPPRMAQGQSHSASRQSRWGYPPQYWNGGWHQHGSYYFGDDASVQSGLSSESYAQPYDLSIYPGGMHQHYFHPAMYAHHQAASLQQGMYDPRIQGANYTPDYGYGHFDAAAWPGQPHQVVPHEDSNLTQLPVPGTDSAYNAQEVPSPTAAYPHSTNSSTVPTPPAKASGDHTPYKYNSSSPYWGHLDHSTLAMMGIATPQGMAASEAASMNLLHSPHGQAMGGDEHGIAGSLGAQPLLLRQPYPLYDYYGGRESFGPPSPATQFMMSPQSNFAYRYGAYTGFSPNRTTSPMQTSPLASKTGAPTSESGVPASVSTPSQSKENIRDDENTANAR